MIAVYPLPGLLGISQHPGLASSWQMGDSASELDTCLTPAGGCQYESDNIRPLMLGKWGDHIQAARTQSTYTLLYLIGRYHPTSPVLPNIDRMTHALSPIHIWQHLGFQSEHRPLRPDRSHCPKQGCISSPATIQHHLLAASESSTTGQQRQNPPHMG